MNKHVEEAMKLRNATPMCNNCAQTILRVYAEENHDGMTDCADLLRANAEKGGEKKMHCDNMIKESIEVMDEVMNQA